MISYLTWPGRMIVFGLQFAKALLMASVEVAWDVVAPNSRFSPGIIEFRLRCRTEFEITAMSNCITLTPGTLTLAVRSDPPTLWVHEMYATDRDKALSELRDFESQMLRALRRDGRVEEQPGGVDSASAGPEGKGR